jgi:hypothetical protein
VKWFHESEEICEHDYDQPPCGIMADSFLATFAVLPKDEAHEHEWRPAGVIEERQERVIVWGMCKCGEIAPRQWDY